MPPTDTSHHFLLTCLDETPTHKRFLTEAYTSWTEGVDAMLDQQQRHCWQSVTLTTVRGPRRVLATGGTLRKTAW
jgi:hypothetical protein